MVPFRAGASTATNLLQTLPEFVAGATRHNKFASCAVISLDFRGFGSSTLTDLYYTFSSCSHLATFYRWLKEVENAKTGVKRALFEIVYADDTPDSKVQMNTWRHELGIREHAARKARMRRLSYERLAGLREIVIDANRRPLTFAEFTLKEFERDKEGNWIDEIPDWDDHSIEAVVRYAMLRDMLCG